MLFHALAQSAVTYPNKEAVITGNKRITYSHLFQQVQNLSARLRSFGINTLDCVAIVIPNSPEFMISYYALSCLHAISLLLDPQLKADELAFYLHDNHVHFILTTTEQYATCRQAMRKVGGNVHSIIVDELLAAATENVPSMKSDDTAIYDGPAIYQYSSGSTGRAKKICRTQKNLACEVQMCTHAMQITAQDTILCPVPLFHAYGLGGGMLVSVAAGATLVLMKHVKHEKARTHTPLILQTLHMLELIEQEHITILPGSPYLFGALAETSEERQYDLSSLRLCLTAGNLLPEETFQRFKKRFGIPLRSAYGSTECGLIAINLEQDADVRHDCVGLPLPGADVKIVSDTMVDLPAETIGAIAIKSGGLTSGYLHRPELNAQAFSDGFFLVGDLGKLDQRGRLSVVGRKRAFIDSGGEKVDPQEIEAVLSSHPAVNEVAVVGVPGPYGAEAIKAVIVPKAPVTEESILALCREKLANYKVPRFVVFRDALPRNSLGKLLKKDLLDEPEEQSGQEEAVSAEAHVLRQTLRAWSEDRNAPQQLLEQWICQRIAELLKEDGAQVDARCPFAEMGLDSLSVVALRDSLAEALNLTFPITSLWSYPTPAALSSYLMVQLSPHTDMMSIQHPVGRPAGASLPPDFEQLQQLSETEVQALLAQEILKQSEK